MEQQFIMVSTCFIVKNSRASRSWPWIISNTLAISGSTSTSSPRRVPSSRTVTWRRCNSRALAGAALSSSFSLVCTMPGLLSVLGKAASATAATSAPASTGFWSTNRFGSFLLFCATALREHSLISSARISIHSGCTPSHRFTIWFITPAAVWIRMQLRPKGQAWGELLMKSKHQRRTSVSWLVYHPTST